MKQDTTSDIRNAMIDWYDNNRRDLPWRAQPFANTNPYHVWMSEIMLQQTTVGAVKSYFEKFIRLWPTVHDLAKASMDDVMREWAGLGYYSRARNLHKCANVIVSEHSGLFPKDIKALKALPGIGDYTSAAIQSIAFDIPSTVIDGNVDRVISRLYAIETPLPHSKPDIRQFAKQLFEGKNTDRPSCFAQSMMDLGATVCIPKNPRCQLCPLSSFCHAKAKGIEKDLPHKAKKQKIPEKEAYVYLNVDKKGYIEVERRSEKGMLAGMVGFPTSDWIPIGDNPNMPESKSGVRHVFTHFALTLYPLIKLHSSIENGVKIDEVDKIGLPALFKKVWLFTKDKIDVIE